ncbi:hypothetical protein [Luteimonas salinilitoris]|uniref:Uncharacterized protein n=1 Tax=Luteimonas salinilitoris TaxID=3237697 RepID=A0ABV4HS39_9GAMM
MKIIAIVLASLFFALLLYSKSSTHNGKNLERNYEYSIATVEERPVPKQVIFLLWRDVAIRGCDEAIERFNITPKECRMKINDKSNSCAALAGEKIPDVIGDKELNRRIGKQYLHCVTPYYFCNGFEVTNEEEAKQKCS